jgi:uncharacterized membrane protein YhfC
MIFLILSAFSGLALVVLPIVAVRKYRSAWQTPKGLFMTAGFAAVLVEIVHAAVLGNGASIWPQVFDLPVYLTALIFGVVSGLFTELGRFLILDRMMKKVRTCREGMMFGLGWGGLQTILYGLIVIVGVLGMSFLAGVTNLEAVFPDTDKNELTAVMELQKQSTELMTGNPLLGLGPLLERVSLVTVDIAMSLLIILGILRGTTSLAWAAVGFRTICTASVIYLNTLNPLLGEAGIVIFGIIAYLIIRRLSESFTVAPVA